MKKFWRDHKHANVFTIIYFCFTTPFMLRYFVPKVMSENPEHSMLAMVMIMLTLLGGLGIWGNIMEPMKDYRRETYGNLRNTE